MINHKRVEITNCTFRNSSAKEKGGHLLIYNSGFA